MFEKTKESPYRSANYQSLEHSKQSAIKQLELVFTFYAGKDRSTTTKNSHRSTSQRWWSNFPNWQGCKSPSTANPKDGFQCRLSTTPKVHHRLIQVVQNLFTSPNSCSSFQVFQNACSVPLAVTNLPKQQSSNKNKQQKLCSCYSRRCII